MFINDVNYVRIAALNFNILLDFHCGTKHKAILVSLTESL